MLVPLHHGVGAGLQRGKQVPGHQVMLGQFERREHAAPLIAAPDPADH
ncbi:MAG: hypothetical protein ACTHKL_20515 [Streptosporangiaceae bacterium]